MAAGRFRATRSVRARRLQGGWLSAAAFIGMLTLVAHLMEVKVRPVVAATARAVATRAATEALNEALSEEVAALADSRRIVHIEKDGRGDIEVAEVDFAAVTALQSAATAHAQEELHKLEHETFPMPIGEVLYGPLFSSIGPRVPVRFTLLGTAHSSIVTQSRTVGINQTVHVIYLDLTAQVNVLTPFTATPTTVTSKMPIAYVVFSGEIPHTYFQ